jgi:recombinational DNA repair protein RecR
MGLMTAAELAKLYQTMPEAEKEIFKGFNYCGSCAFIKQGETSMICSHKDASDSYQNYVYWNFKCPINKWEPR